MLQKTRTEKNAVSLALQCWGYASIAAENRVVLLNVLFSMYKIERYRGCGAAEITGSHMILFIRRNLYSIQDL
jgi:hypothetical protein